ncbi:MAG: mechanosensitive ion channel [Saprospiraceae bacterium]|nr:mechanosensitive ion channel [Saprospiraceae bacterium]
MPFIHPQGLWIQIISRGPGLCQSARRPRSGTANTFADLLAGFILLIEGNIAVGDIVVIDGMVGVVRNIKLRTTEIKTRDLVFIIVPNSKLVANNVTNWSHNESPARFTIDVQVGYKEDIEKVERILLTAAASLPDIVQNPKPTVQVVGLGEYSISLKLVIYSDELFLSKKSSPTSAKNPPGFQIQ